MNVKTKSDVQSPIEISPQIKKSKLIKRVKDYLVGNKGGESPNGHSRQKRGSQKMRRN